MALTDTNRHLLAASHPVVRQLRWARCSGAQHLHLLGPAGVVTVEEGECVAVCGRVIWPERHTFSSESRGLCEGCVAARRAW